jgi:hypothetical protein
MRAAAIAVGLIHMAASMLLLASRCADSPHVSAIGGTIAAVTSSDEGNVVSVRPHSRDVSTG